MNSRKYLVGALAAVLLIWGFPFERLLPDWFVIRIGYLIAIPLAAWFLLGWIWKKWQPDEAADDRLLRALVGATGGVFVVLAIFKVIADTHVGNTMWIQTRDGREAVGDDIVLRGPDWGHVAVLLILAGFAFWFSITKKE
jgi:hypothetical protein